MTSQTPFPVYGETSCTHDVDFVYVSLEVED